MRTLLLSLALVISFGVFAQDAKYYDSDVADHYFDYSLKLVKETMGFSPPVAARAFGYMGLTLYEAVVPGIPSQLSTKGVLYEFNTVTAPDPNADYHWPTVANNAMAMIVDSLFRTMTAANRDSLYKVRDHYNNTYQGQISIDAYDDSKAFGEAIAIDVLNYSRTDGGHNSFAENFPSSYIPPVGPDLWVPFGMQTAMQPYWGTHRPFIQADSSTSVISPAPPAFSTVPGSVFYLAAYEDYTIGNNLTPEQTTIAQYWADGGGTMTPAGHSISMLNNILVEKEANLEEAAIAYAKLGIALSDAFLACWKTKFIYNLCRPVTYIRSHIDSTWTPLIGTPPFPEYPSGHSSQSGAMATVMSGIFGDAYVFIDSTHGTNFGGPRSFSSFQEAAEEAAISRLYGGIHYRFGNEAGLTLGELVGANVNALFEQVNVSTDFAGNERHAVQLFPNPVTDVLHLKYEHSLANANFSIINMDGKIITEGKLNETETTVSFESAMPGLYVVQFGNEKLSIPFSKQ